jgi:hypothetical protein
MRYFCWFAGYPADHEGANDIQPLLGKKQAHPIRVNQRVQVGAVVRLA